MKINKSALFFAVQIFMIVAGILFAAKPQNQLLWQVMPVVRYYPVVNQWAVSLPKEAGPGMGWYGITTDVLLISFAAMAISYAVAYLPFAKGRRLSTKLELALTIISIAALIIGVTLMGLHEYEEWGLKKPTVP